MSSTKEVDVVAIIKPKPGKGDRVVELLTNLASAVHKNEPGALRYHLHREFDSKDGSEDLVMIEKYVYLSSASAVVGFTSSTVFVSIFCFRRKFELDCEVNLY
ncbi:MAG: hypothetical protein M1830_007619 [Pleopsidium flavum]|nr:MAG: hypothetical protein M1830_008863 [Pleopsidium flavum]KAI9875978.1 MAG: hypothetical protein M1830_007619 [Pleopsidium flavum]